MKKFLFSCVFFIIFVCTSFAGQTIAKKAGLGDTFTDIEALWNKGYKKESPAGSTDMAGMKKVTADPFK